MEKLIISVGVTGGTHGPNASPHIPLTPEEIGESAYAAFEAGAAIAHIHVRDDQGFPCHDLERYRRVIEILASRCDMIVNLTTDLRHPDGVRSLSLRPSLASFPAGTVQLGEHAIVAPLPVLRKLAVAFRKAGTKPELEIFHEGMITNCCVLRDEALIDTPLYFQLYLGVPGLTPATPRNLLHLLLSLPTGCVWTVNGVGLANSAMAAMAVILGGHVRVGLEDQLHYRTGQLAESNAELVARVARIGNELEREIATPAEARRILGLAAVDHGVPYQ